MTRWLSSGVLWLALCACGAAAAEPFAMPQSEQGIAEAQPRVELFEDRSGLLTSAQVLALSTTWPTGKPVFAPAPVDKLLAGGTGSAFWLRLELANPADVARHVHLSLAESRSNDADYLLRNHRTSQQAWSRRCGAMGELTALPALVRTPAFEISVGPAACDEILVRVVTQGDLRLQPHLYFGEALNQLDLQDALKSSALIGGLLMLTGLSLVWWLLSGHASLAWQSLGLMFLTLNQVLGHRLVQYFIDSIPYSLTLQGANVLGGLCPLMGLLYLYSLARSLKLRITGLPVFIAMGTVQAALCVAMLASDAYVFVQASHFGMLAIMAALIVALRFHLKPWKLRYGTVILSALTMLWMLSFRALAFSSLSPVAAPGIQPTANRLAICTVVLIGLAFWIHHQVSSRQRNERLIAELTRRQSERIDKAVTRLTRTLNTALAAAQHAHRQQMRLMACIGHDLRAPMATIVGYARLLRDVKTRTYKKHIATIERWAAHQLVLIEELVEHARGELHLLGVKPVSIDLRALLDEVGQLAVPLAAQQHNVYLANLSWPFPNRVMLDGTRLRQVLLNLISNAAKFTEAGNITLEVVARSDGPLWTLAFELVDTGTGIADDDQERIFESFEQAQPTAGSLGLGLFIARRIVEQMGGQLTLNSVPGVGSAFRFEIAVTEVATDEAPVPLRLPAGKFMRPLTAGAAPVPVAAVIRKTTDASLAQLFTLASNGQWTDIRDWIAENAFAQPECRDFIATVKRLLEELDFDGIRDLVESDMARVPASVYAGPDVAETALAGS